MGEPGRTFSGPRIADCACAANLGKAARNCRAYSSNCSELFSIPYNRSARRCGAHEIEINLECSADVFSTRLPDVKNGFAVYDLMNREKRDNKFLLIAM
jgi:hypothetical protein